MGFAAAAARLADRVIGTFANCSVTWAGGTFRAVLESTRDPVGDYLERSEVRYRLTLLRAAAPDLARGDAISVTRDGAGSPEVFTVERTAAADSDTGLLELDLR